MSMKTEEKVSDDGQREKKYFQFKLVWHDNLVDSAAV